MTKEKPTEFEKTFACKPDDPMAPLIVLECLFHSHVSVALMEYRRSQNVLKPDVVLRGEMGDVVRHLKGLQPIIKRTLEVAEKEGVIISSVSLDVAMRRAIEIFEKRLSEGKG